MPGHTFATALGPCRIEWQGAELTGFGLLSDRRESEDPTTPPAWVDAVRARVCAHLAGQAQDFSDLPYAWTRVSLFQREVYQAALRVTSGRTQTYGELAAALGHGPGASRAVGTALGQNPWPLLVPCHRFLGAKGRMTGFSAPGGIHTKLRLLALEGSELLAE